MQQNYTTYSAADFLEDSFFIQWLRDKTPEASLFWETWMAEHPPNLEEMKQARLQLETVFSLKRIVHQPEKARQLWSRLEYNLAVAEENKRLQRRRLWIAAASLGVLLMAGAMLFYFSWYRGGLLVETGKGEHRSLRLPDGTEVTLNENSSLRYPRFWNTRDVELRGEAFFDVKHMDKKRFRVYTSDLFIEVLGTRFNVRNRGQHTRVSLVNGRILIGTAEHPERALELKPGEVAGYSHNKGRLQKQRGSVALHYAWKDRMITLENTTVSEIISTAEDIFDCRIRLSDPAMGNRKIMGAIPLRSDTSVVYILSNLLHANISKEGDTWILEADTTK
jgi:transmembrane sensor